MSSLLGKVVPLGVPLAGLHSEMLWSQHDILGNLSFFVVYAGFPSRCVTCTIGSLHG